jgi:hypothetical protein
LGLTLEQVQSIAFEKYRDDPKSIYQLLYFEFDTLEPIKKRNPKNGSGWQQTPAM